MTLDSPMDSNPKKSLPYSTAWQFMPGLLIVLMGTIFFFCFDLKAEIPHLITGWVITTPIFAVPWVLLKMMPRLHHPVVLLALSGLRLMVLPLLLLLLKKSPNGPDPKVLGWTLGLYIISLIGMILLEMREPAKPGSSIWK